MATKYTIKYDVNGGTSDGWESWNYSSKKTISSTIPENKNEAGSSDTEGTHFKICFDYTRANSLGLVYQDTQTFVGYAFKEWNTKKDGSGTTYVKGQELNMTSTTITLYAQWEEVLKEKILIPKIILDTTKKQYDRTVIFNAAANEASCEVESLTHQVTETYSVSGWHYSTMSGSTPSFSGGETYYPTKDTTLYAIKNTTTSVEKIIIPTATKKSKCLSRQVNFDGNGGNVPSSTNALANINYYFVGWNTTLKEDNETETYARYYVGEEETFKNDTVLYPHFRYSSNYVYSLQLPRQEECFKSGYSLLGWSTTPSAIVETYEPGQVIKIDSENITLYAIWGSNTITVNYWATDASEGYYQNLPIRDFTAPVFSKTYGLNETVTIQATKNPLTLNVSKVGYEPRSYWKSIDSQLTFNCGDTIVAKDLANAFNKDTDTNKNIIINLYISWEAQVYELTLDPQLGNEKTKTIIFNRSYDYTRFTKADGSYYYGYTWWHPDPILGTKFCGWWYTPDISLDVSVYTGRLIEREDIVDIPDNHKLYGAWDSTNHTITVDPMGGYVTDNNGKLTTKPKSIDSTYLSTVQIAPPVRSQYTFVGWVQRPYFNPAASVFELRKEGSHFDNSFIENSLFIDSDPKQLPQAWNDATLNRIEDDSAGYYYTINITSYYNNILEKYGGFCQLVYPLDDSDEEVSYIHTFMAKVPKGEALEYQSNLKNNPKVRFSWLVNPWGTGEWMTYAYQVVCEPGFLTLENSSFGAINIANNDHHTPVEWKIATNQITKNPDQTQTVICGPLKDYLYAQWVLTPSIYRFTKKDTNKFDNTHIWKKGVPYIYIDGIWRQAVPYIFDGEKWQLNS